MSHPTLPLTAEIGRWYPFIAPANWILNSLGNHNFLREPILIDAMLTPIIVSVTISHLSEDRMINKNWIS